VETGRTKGQRKRDELPWVHVTATLYFLGVLPYHEALYRNNYHFLPQKWLGRERARQLADDFVATAVTIGYRHARQVRKQGATTLLQLLAFTRKTDPAALTTTDLGNWEQRPTTRSVRVTRAGVTCVQRVLAANGYLGGEPPRAAGGPAKTSFGWGCTAPEIVATCERFLRDLGTVRAPGTVGGYKVALRRFGDWLGEHDPAVRSVAAVRRSHIEAYKQALETMRCGDYTNANAVFHIAHLGEPLSAAHKVRAISCLRAFFERIEVLEYPERPGRPLFVRGDVRTLDQETPRFIPDADWHRIVAAVEQLSPEQATEHRLLPPFERARAVLAVLLEGALRAGELCRLDTACLVTTRDLRSHAETYWLRVPVGKLKNDRLIPIRPRLVEAIDAWMRVRGPQPMHRDGRTGKRRDLLFTWQGARLQGHALNALIARVCALAGTPRYTSHQFRHTLAVQWRQSGMKLETIGRLLGHRTLQMTLRYAAVMPETARREFDAAFAKIDEEHRGVSHLRVLLSPEAHLAARAAWRESLWVDLGVGFCGLSAYIPCANRLVCLPCPNYISTSEDLPLLERQRGNLIELRTLLGPEAPVDRAEELDSAIAALDEKLAAAAEAMAPSRRPATEPAPAPASQHDTL
jgi:integrase